MGVPGGKAPGCAKANQSGVRRAREISLRKFKRKAPAALGLLLFEEVVPEIGVEPTRQLRRRIFFLLRLSPPLNERS